MTTSSINNTITDCTLDTIYLTDDSQLSIKDCTGLDESKIKTINSEYKITNEQSNNLLKTQIAKVRLRILLLNKIYSILASRNIASMSIRK